VLALSVASIGTPIGGAALVAVTTATVVFPVCHLVFVVLDDSRKKFDAAMEHTQARARDCRRAIPSNMEVGRYLGSMEREVGAAWARSRAPGWWPA